MILTQDHTALLVSAEFSLTRIPDVGVELTSDVMPPRGLSGGVDFRARNSFSNIHHP